MLKIIPELAYLKLFSKIYEDFNLRDCSIRSIESDSTAWIKWLLY